VQAAEEAPPFRSLIDPDDPMFLKPDDMPQAMQQWCRQREVRTPETGGELVRCALESLALKYRLVLGQLEELTGTAVEVIHIVGGGSQNELLNQLTANACRRPVVAGPVEATALGNVLVQARAAGAIGTLGEIREVVRNSYELKRYEPRDESAWQDAYHRFQQLIRQR
jgi:rhamnulokinase